MVFEIFSSKQKFNYNKFSELIYCYASVFLPLLKCCRCKCVKKSKKKIMLFEKA